jgi:hypothetical protein
MMTFTLRSRSHERVFLDTSHLDILYARHHKIVVPYLWSLFATSDKCLHQWSPLYPVPVKRIAT